MSYLLALDQGTTSSRSLLFSEDGDIVGVALQEFEQIFPQPGWVEHDPEAIWASQVATIREVLDRAGASAADIKAIGITNQRETTVVWNRKTGQAIHNAIVWQDRRTAAMIDRAKADGHEDLIRSRTGLVPDAYFSGSKVGWILDNVDGARDLAAKGELAFGTIDTWLIHKLTGGTLHITDATNASRTMLMDIHRGALDDELLAIWRIPASLLPEVRASSEVYGEVSAAAVPELGGIPIAGIAGDQQAALFGQMCIERGMTKNTYGTGCFMLMSTETQAVASQNNLLTTIACQRNGTITYALEGAVFIGGAVVQWLRDGLKMVDSAPEIEALAGSVPDSGGAVLVPAFVGLGAPHWDQYARGVLCGITRGVTDAHIARAALDAIAFQSTELAEAMEADSGGKLPQLRVDGGASANNLLMQIQADLMQRPVVRAKVTETTALGAAYLAGLATGVWQDTDTLHARWQVDREFTPQISADEAAERKALWSRAVDRARSWEA